MSERLGILCLACCLLGVAAPAPAGAQDVGSLRARRDSIAAEYRAAVAAFNARREAVTAREAARVAALDTTAAGPFRVAARERELPTAARYVAAAWARLAPSLGEQQSRIPRRTFLVAVSSSPGRLYALRGPDADVIWLGGGPAEQDFAAEAAIWRAMYELVPNSLRFWSGGGYYQERTDWAAVHRELATSSAIPAKECLAGRLSSCLVALALDTLPAGPRSWYTPARLRSLALARSRSSSPERLSCERGVTEACIDLLPLNAYPPPVSSRSRLAFLELALQHGGAGAFARLVGDPAAAVRESVAAAAGRPLEALAAEWRERALGARRSAGAGVGGTLAVTLLWSLVLAWLAARSTRCRLG